MVEAVQQTQQLLREINAHTPHYPLQSGMMCAALIGGKLLVASSGPAFALVRASERVHMFPSEPTTTVGGYGNIPVEVYRQDVQADDAMFLGGGGWLRRVPTRTLASIVAFINADNCPDAADELFDQAGQMQVPGVLIVLGSGSNNVPPRPSGYGGSSGGGGYPSFAERWWTRWWDITAASIAYDRALAVYPLHSTRPHLHGCRQARRCLRSLSLQHPNSRLRLVHPRRIGDIIFSRATERFAPGVGTAADGIDTAGCRIECKLTAT